MAQLHLPVLGPGSLGVDGKRRRPYPADVSGRFVRARRAVYLALLAFWAILPWVDIGGHPAVFLDVEQRRFFFFGTTWNAQDVWLTFFLVTGLGFALVVATALLGRVFCGWVCPQTVFIELFFRPIERLVNGPRNIALKREKDGTAFDRGWRRVVTHALYILSATLIAHVFLAYFVSLPKVFGMVRASPSAHPEAFGWMLGTTTLFYVAFGLFREQFCVVMCPYGRLQSVLLDDDSLVVGYDERRGEPRGKAKAENVGDCVDCNRCVVVCPTGIDIRQGLQLDCIACTACIDACDDVMTRLGRPRGLVRYDSQRGLRGEAKRIFRPRIAVYGVLLVLGAVVASLAFRGRTAFEANVLRLAGPPYAVEGTTLRNGFELHVVNKTSNRATFTIAPTGNDLGFVVPMTRIEIEPLGSRRVPFFVTMEQARFDHDRPFVVHVEGAGSARDVHAVFLGARR